MLENTPFDDDTEQALDSAKSVRPNELIVLILRACLDPANPAYALLQSCNSRTVTAQDLRTVLQPCVREIGFDTVHQWIIDFLATSSKMEIKQK